jgi:hypothetical protein
MWPRNALEDRFSCMHQCWKYEPGEQLKEKSLSMKPRKEKTIMETEQMNPAGSGFEIDLC